MGVGKFQDVVTIYGRDASNRDAYGGVIETFITKWSGLGELGKLSGSRAIAAGAAVLNGTWTLKIRRNPNIEFIKTDVVEIDGKEYGIASIEEVDNDRFLEFIISSTE